MKITPHLDQAVLKGPAKPEKKANLETPTPTPPSVSAEISDEAREKALTASGKNAASPAHRAREMLSSYENLGHQHFGRLVSSIARGEAIAAPNDAPAPTSPEDPPAVPAEPVPADVGVADESVLETTEDENPVVPGAADSEASPFSDAPSEHTAPIDPQAAMPETSLPETGSPGEPTLTETTDSGSEEETIVA